MSRSTEELIRELAGDLPAVRPLGRVRAVLAFALAVSLPFYAWWYASHGLRHQFVEGQVPGLMYLLAASTLALLAAGGLVCGLTSAIPGRENDARAGRLIFVAGALIALAALFVRGFVDETTLLEGFVSSQGCIRGAVLLSLPAGLVIGRYVMRGAARSRPAALAVGFAGGVGLAAVIVHLTCPHPDALHMVVGHAAAPLYAGVGLMALASVLAAVVRPGQGSA